MRSYINETLGISLNHPSTWAVKESKNSFWLEPISTEEALTMQRDSAILVTVYDIPYKRDYSLKEINKRYKSNVSLNATGLSWSWYMKSYRLLDSGDATLFGKPGRYFDSTGDVGGDKYRVLHTAASFDKKLFEVRYRSHPDTFEKDLPAFQEMLATLSLGTPESIPSSARDRRRERAARRAGQ